MLDRATLVVGVLLLVSLTFLSWHADGPPPTAGGAPGRAAVQGPGATAAIAAASLALVTVTWLALATIAPRPPVARPPARVLLSLAVSTFAFVLIKLAADLTGLSRGAWVSLAMAICLVAVRIAAFRRPPDRAAT